MTTIAAGQMWPTGQSLTLIWWNYLSKSKRVAWISVDCHCFEKRPFEMFLTVSLSFYAASVMRGCFTLASTHPHRQQSHTSFPPAHPSCSEPSTVSASPVRLSLAVSGRRDPSRFFLFISFIFFCCFVRLPPSCVSRCWRISSVKNCVPPCVC